MQSDTIVLQFIHEGCNVHFQCHTLKLNSKFYKILLSQKFKKKNSLPIKRFHV